MKLSRIIITILFLLLLGTTIHLYKSKKQLELELEDLGQSSHPSHRHITDTVIIPSDFFNGIKNLKTPVNPVRISVSPLLQDSEVRFGKTGSKSSSELANDTMASTHGSVQSFSEEDSLIAFKLDRSNLNLSFFNSETNTYHSRLFYIDPNNYRYQWYQGKLTTEKIKTPKITFHPYIYGKYRPFNQLWDIGAGLSLKTNHFIYKLGLNSFYYPKFYSGLGVDLELSVTYNF